MKARIHKDVRPYAGRIFPVIEIVNEQITVDVSSASNRSWFRDLRVYRKDEVDLIKEQGE